MKKLYGLLGEKLSHSYSPKIHNLIFKELNIPGNYKLFEIKKSNLKEKIKEFISKDIKGVNVTIPYKIEVINYLDELSFEAQKIGAVNTLKFKNNKIIGYNTDYYGFGSMLKRYTVNIKNNEAVILGTGGAAKSVIQYLLDNQIKNITLISRHPNNAKEYFKDFKTISYNSLKILKGKDLIINCTPCGMYPKIENSPITKEILEKFQTAIDLIYNPKETLFLKNAKDKGLKTVNGLYMLIYQAIKSQEIWNDFKIKEEMVDKIYEKLK